MPIVPENRAGRATSYSSAGLAAGASAAANVTRRIKRGWHFIIREARFMATDPRFTFNFFLSQSNGYIFDRELDARGYLQITAVGGTNYTHMAWPKFFWPGYPVAEGSDIRFEVTDTSAAANTIRIDLLGEEYPADLCK